MSKKVIANIVMIAIIMVIAVCGMAMLGHVKGWFDKNDDNRAYLTDYRGIITLERDGIAFTTNEDTVLRTGDKISCEAGATVKIAIGEDYVTLGQSANALITNPEKECFTLELTGGEAFVNTDSFVVLEFEGKQTEVRNAVASLSVRKGAQSISVYYGDVGDAKSGQMLEWIGEDLSVKSFTINSLNEFNISQIRQANETKTLVFSNADLDKLEAERWAQMNKSDENTVAMNDEADKNTKTEETNSPEVTKAPEITAKPDETTGPSDTEISNVTNKPANTKLPEETIKPKETIWPEETNTPVTTKEPESTMVPEAGEPKLTCTITIRCDTILNNRSDLDPAKAIYVPDNGCILPVVELEFEKGETVFDVLNRACKQYGIQIEYSWTPLYDSYYIEGINNLYEFDCGYESGWMYKVNGWFPNYGCSSYTLTGGETIVWCYTCKGLGEDVGAERW